VRSFSRQYPVPTYVAEFLLGRYCATTTRPRSPEGLQIVARQLQSRSVRAGEEELFKARAREQGSVRIIDLVSARLDAKTDSYLAELAEPAPARRSHHARAGPPARADADRRLLRRGRAGVRRRHRPGGHGRPFGVASLREIQLSKRDVLRRARRGPPAALDRRLEGASSSAASGLEADR
jgi:ATP-dependent Lon protease